ATDACYSTLPCPVCPNLGRKGRIMLWDRHGTPGISLPYDYRSILPQFLREDRCMLDRAIRRSILMGWLVSGAVAHAELPSTPDNSPESQPAAASPPEWQLQEVTVTANRRQESNQRVPLGIATLSAADAAKVGVVDAQSLAAVVPGLLFNRQAN